MIIAEQCTWTCEESMEVSKNHHVMDMQDADVAMKLELERNLGRIVLGSHVGGRERTGPIRRPSRIR